MTRKILKIGDVEERTGKKKSSIYMDIKAGTFPAPISLGGRSRGWVDTDIDEWLDRRIALSRQRTEGLSPLSGGK
jgi:prophage regulatory protein